MCFHNIVNTIIMIGKIREERDFKLFFFKSRFPHRNETLLYFYQNQIFNPSITMFFIFFPSGRFYLDSSSLFH